MRTLAPRLAITFAAASLACVDPPAGLDTTTSSASQLASGSGRGVRRIGTDPKTGLDLLAVSKGGLDETDAPGAFDLVRLDDVHGTGSIVAAELIDAVVAGRALYLVHADGRLTREVEGSRELVFGGAFEAPALLPSGAVVVARRTSEPGESDLWIVDARSSRALAPAPGPDHTPVALPDGRVAFVSGRSTVASIWVADPDSGEATQLTNRGLVAGGSREGFVPTPAERMEVAGDELRFDAGAETWIVDPRSGAARREEVAR